MKTATNFIEELFKVSLELNELDGEFELETVRKIPIRTHMQTHKQPNQFSVFDETEDTFKYEDEVEMRWRMRPPVVPQGNTFKCWAAAMSSWAQITRGVIKFKRDDLVDHMRRRGFVTLRDGLRSPDGVRELIRIFGLKFQRIRGGGSLSCVNLCPKLKHSHVVVLFRRPDATVHHAVVIYGVDRFNICFMDPVVPGNFCRRIFEFGDGADDFFVMWRE